MSSRVHRTVLIHAVCSSHHHLVSSSGVEVTYIVVVLAVIFALAAGGLTISFYIRYEQEAKTESEGGAATMVTFTLKGQFTPKLHLVLFLLHLSPPA